MDDTRTFHHHPRGTLQAPPYQNSSSIAGCLSILAADATLILCTTELVSRQRTLQVQAVRQQSPGFVYLLLKSSKYRQQTVPLDFQQARLHSPA